MVCDFCRNFGQVIVHYPGVTKVKQCPRCKGESFHTMVGRTTSQEITETISEKTALEYRKELASNN